jgi:hypothetical protein
MNSEFVPIPYVGETLPGGVGCVSGGVCYHGSDDEPCSTGQSRSPNGEGSVQVSNAVAFEIRGLQCGVVIRCSLTPFDWIVSEPEGFEGFRL